MPSRRRGAKWGAIVFAVLAALWAIVIFSPVAHPRDLQVDGITGSSTSRIRALLTEAAKGQSTFHVSTGDLMAAVSDYPEVAGVEVEAHPPFRLDLQVIMRPPVARVEMAGRVFAVAGDGTVLQRIGGAHVPTLDASLGRVSLSGDRFHGGGGALTLLAKAPDVLLPAMRTVRRGQSGLEVELDRGPRLIFGNSTGAADKWAAAAAVIAEGSAARATYIDLRVPGRPAIGGLGGSHSAGETDLSATPPSLTPVTPTAATQAGAATGTTSGDTSTQTQAPTGGASAEAAPEPQATPEATPSAGTQTPSSGTATADDSPAADTAVEPVTQTPSAGAATGGATVSGGATP